MKSGNLRENIQCLEMAFLKRIIRNSFVLGKSRRVCDFKSCKPESGTECRLTRRFLSLQLSFPGSLLACCPNAYCQESTKNRNAFDHVQKGMTFRKFCIEQITLKEATPFVSFNVCLGLAQRRWPRKHLCFSDVLSFSRVELSATFENLLSCSA